MNKKQLIPILFSAAFQLACSNSNLQAQSQSREIAFLSDVHLQDVYADLNSDEFKGVLNPKTGKFATIRTMKSQLNSTRLFNENYFSFISALEDLKTKGIKLVVLPGDFTDDGQPMNVLALKKILDQYSADSGMRFFLTTGNHDPVKPFGGIAGKSDFLGTYGGQQAIAGSKEVYPSTHTAISDQINYWGYPEITETLSAYGFFPSQKDIFWTHPFEEFDYDNYNFEQVQANSHLEKRVYASGENRLTLPDASYLVEPIDGVWLLALDGNVYTYSGSEWKGSSVGFNQAAFHKNHQLDWISKVTSEAKKRGKTLISFSHYPLVEFHDGASEEMKSLFGNQKFQLARVPHRETSNLYAAAGIQIHFAGHMHINDTGIFQDHRTKNTMYNIQVPSLAAFPPAYKTVKTTDVSNLEIETIPLTEVDHMNEFFDLYRMEHKWLFEKQDPGIWDSTILASQDYMEYTRNHLLELTKSRFIPSDWPENLAILLQNLSPQELINWGEMNETQGESFLQEKLKKLKASTKSTLPYHYLIDDFYLLKNGDELGKEMISEDRIRLYENIFYSLSQKSQGKEPSLNRELNQFFGIFEKLYHSNPSDHFAIDLKNNTIKKIED
ncbi:metallophosphoesterase [Algoriphagus machipongonensis]|uniref:Ser/Thr protein phosphatase family protein n=1 Tax=Algoriphagus machipongonensis TaxID=388413 RepID=A3HWH3_9BACT|nr:metallophosphoesterase [Algoriphagus machipongonensis]EAZ80946.1 Ser/Thr protein phosphatase family protein [Algoriphagus machipongonensis]